MELVAILKKLMHQHQLTVTQLAERSGVGQPVIHRLITGELSEPKLKTVQKLAVYFEVTLGQLAGMEPLPQV